MIKKVFPSFDRFAYLCIIVGIAFCCFGLIEFFSYRSLFAEAAKDAKSTGFGTFFPIKEVSVFMFFYGLAAIAGGTGIALHKNWGKKILLILSWILVLYVIGFGIYFQISISKISQSLFGMQIFFRILSILFNVVFIYALYSLIKYISKSKFKQPDNNKNRELI